jgi:hypothetical protein
VKHWKNRGKLWEIIIIHEKFHYIGEFTEVNWKLMVLPMVYYGLTMVEPMVNFIGLYGTLS